MQNLKYISLVVLVYISTSLSGQKTSELVELSGIAYHKGELAVVGDESGWVYYRFKSDPKVNTSFELKSVDKKIKPVKNGIKDVDVDLESIDFTPNGEIVVLSEKHASIWNENGLLMQYSNEYKELAGRGLEGIAITKSDNSDYDWQSVAVWEGGYLEKRKMPDSLDGERLRKSFQPILLHHYGGAQDASKSSKVKVVELEMDLANYWLNDISGIYGEPHAFRFRVPDLVWYKGDVICLLSSEREPALSYGQIGNAKFGIKALQRFDLDGKAKGEPVDLTRYFKKAETSHNKNWEGMSWLVEGESLILCMDAGNGNEVTIIELPTLLR